MSSDKDSYGAHAEDLWKLYYMLPEICCVTFKFYEIGSDEVKKEISIWKDNEHKISVPNDKDEEKSVTISSHYEGEKELYAYLGEYGLGPYYLKLEWNYGFGNSVVIEVTK